MKNLLIFILAAFISLPSIAQEPEKKLTRKEKRELKKAEEAALSEAMSKILAVAIDSAQWVIEAHTLADKRGSSIPVNSNLNFIAIEGKEAFVQLGSNSGLGPNGVGGVSVRANISKYEVKKNEKKGTYFITVYATSAIGSFDIRIDTNADGQIASATVQGNSSSRVRYSGQLVPVSHSTVYKGTPLF
ncbi:DUF4251 domain-containing protein [Carboxylicivirga sp. N1Y90]|uniref:DUF4251 domain-containing protein n=1 Tax=Carboxylicivirga fragile TaxID=3417571 RepID=UPI003D354361|nr:DUF4251 domain-containing protein [Marinilabiliaceae bacterium N1Y90]